MEKEGLKGIDNVISNINKQLGRITANSLQGMIRAVVIVQRDMNFTPPKVPVDTRNLQASFFISSSLGKLQGTGASTIGIRNDITKSAEGVLATRQSPTVIFGFSANYAVFVHENMEAKFKRPGAGPWFFKAALERNQGKMINEIAKYSKL